MNRKTDKKHPRLTTTKTPIVMLNKDGVFLKSFPSIVAAHEETGLSI